LYPSPIIVNTPAIVGVAVKLNAKLCPPHSFEAEVARISCPDVDPTHPAAPPAITIVVKVGAPQLGSIATWNDFILSTVPQSVLWLKTVNVNSCGAPADAVVGDTARVYRIGFGAGANGSAASGAARKVFAPGETAFVAVCADMPRNSFTESTNVRDAALVPDANVAAETSNINTTELRPTRRNFDLPFADEWDDGVRELSDLMDII
jgi:hypothetical protein